MTESEMIVLNTWDEKINHFSNYYWLKELDSLSIRIRCRAFVFQNNISRLLHTFFGVSYSSTILWYTDYSATHDRENGLLITTEGFHYSDTQQKFNIKWVDIKSIELVQNPEAKIVINTFDNGWTFPAYCFILNNQVGSLNTLANILNSVLSATESLRNKAQAEAKQTELESKETADLEAIKEKVDTILGKYQKADQDTRNTEEYKNLLFQALDLCNENVGNFSMSSAFTYFNKIRCTLYRILSAKFTGETAKQYADKAWFYLDEWNKSLGGNMSDYPIQKAIALANCAYPIKNAIQGRNIVLEYLSNNEQHIDFGTKIFKQINARIVDYLNSNSFSNNDELIPFHERQFIMFAKSSEKIPGYYDPEDNMKWIFPLDNYPKDLFFQGYPEADVLYMVNPVKQNEYIPFEQAEDFLFMDKVREFCRFVQCLGATEISFRSLKGKKVSNSSNTSHDAELNMKVIAKGELNANLSNSNNSSYSSNQSVEMRQTFTPNRAPFCPDDLVWLKTDANMRELLKQRLEYGTINSYSYKISSSETCQLTNRKALDIKASFEKIMVKVNANYSQSTDTTFNNHEETEWEINVIFKPISELPNPSNVEESTKVKLPQMNVTDAENKYVEFVKLILEDGTIEENERKTLERRRLKLGISVERAKQLEEMLMCPPLAENEKEYFDEIYAMLDDGIIDDKERKVLNMLLEDLDIDPSRAKEIEQMAKNQMKL